MAAPVTGPVPVKLSSGPAPLTPDQQYWRSFKSQIQISSPTSASVSSISSIPIQTKSTAKSDLFAVTTGTRIQLYSGKTRKNVKTISRFSDTAHSAELRHDGRVLVAGDDSGLIQVFDVNSRAILKTWHEHKQPVWTTRFSPTETTSLLSTSDDKTVRLWDLASDKSVVTFSGHGDYVRSGVFMPNRSGFIASGSYDGNVMLWDSRTPERPVMTFQHKAPIEAVLPMPAGTMLLAASDNKISVLDLVAAKPLRLLQNHQKTVTSLCIASKGERVVSGGLDGQVKVYETKEWSVIYGLKYPSPVLAVNVISSSTNGEDNHLAVGMESGLLSIRTRFSGKEKERERLREKEMKALLEGTLEEHDKKLAKKRGRGWEKATRGKEFKGDGAEFQIDGGERVKAKRESEWELLLRQGRYGQALDKVLDGVST